MMKRRDLMKELRRIAREKNVELEIREGGNHTVVTIGGNTTTVPRHNEIGEIMARATSSKQKELKNESHRPCVP